MKDILLIKISGKDRPGVTSTVTSLLSSYNASILDIGQAVIHANLALGMLVELDDADAVTPAVIDALKKMQLTAAIDKVSAEDYLSWVNEQGKPRHIVTLLARKISAGHINQLTEMVARHGLNIDRITRLSGRVPLGDLQENSKACVELSLRGYLPNEKAVRLELLELATTLNIDIAYQ